MDRAKWIASCAQNEEDRVLLARVYERIEQGQRRNIPAATCFLSPREQALCDRLLRGAGMDGFAFFGVFERAERCVCAWVPDYDEDWLTGGEGPIVALRAGFYSGDSLTHRDFLGSLMGCGIKRETVGDILVGAGQCDLLVLREIAPYVSQNLLSAGRSRLSLTEIPLGGIQAPEQKTQTIEDTVATLRLDSLLGSGFRLSRGKAAALIEAGRASVNHLPCLKPDKLLAEGDILTLQGYGKLRLEAVRGNTKKGRVAVTLLRFT